MLVEFRYPAMKDRSGRPILVSQSLIENGHRPDGGWSTSVIVNGSSIMLTGDSPGVVVTKFRDLLTLNRIEFTERAVWSTLNLSWLSRTSPRRQLVSLKEFSAGCLPFGDDPAFTGRSPSVQWLPPVLDAIGFFLCINQERYTHDDFAFLVKILVKIADPSISHSTGDRRALTTLLERYDNLRYKPRHLLSEARDWFIETSNSLRPLTGKALVTKETATLKYSWYGTQN